MVSPNSVPWGLFEEINKVCSFQQIRRETQSKEAGDEELAEDYAMDREWNPASGIHRP